ncbi:hypothetical protein K435DRAFT_813534 [Dendrothele bispora CBS 962.96]|uniref:Uncharacterized protein n=1 Tax=Dendrothele bispora (strain CBS 962.96) TaxID=1314807 RepID=A0A4S8KL56_DENBC|nr:hypothetical protein K435DRAFT_813534 [Dendrothele bispora CBS 962.96]
MPWILHIPRAYLEQKGKINIGYPGDQISRRSDRVVSVSRSTEDSGPIVDGTWVGMYVRVVQKEKLRDQAQEGVSEERVDFKHKTCRAFIYTKKTKQYVDGDEVRTFPEFQRFDSDNRTLGYPLSPNVPSWLKGSERAIEHAGVPRYCVSYTNPTSFHFKEKRTGQRERRKNRGEGKDRGTKEESSSNTEAARKPGSTEKKGPGGEKDEKKGEFG